ncbi:MAG: hypothetical protein HKN16_02115 [Saprospiraceae bacterium]|nr:hypothetical protein [Saprospiraceae bacterium]
MKKVLLMFACLGVFAFGAQAQKASCTKSKASCVKSAKVTGTASIDDAVVAKAASLDETVERRVCEKSGSVSYFQNSTCPVSGKVTAKEVSYNTATGKFVNVSPEAMSKSEKKACSAKGAAKKVSGKSAKACCSGAEAKACCAKGAKASKASCSKSAKKAANTRKVKVSSMEQ